MQFRFVFLLAVCVTLASCQETSTISTSSEAPPTSPPTPTPAPTPAPTSTTSSTTTIAPTTTPKPTTTKPTSSPKTKEPTLGNYTILNGTEEICLVALLKLTVLQNDTRVPIVNGSVNQAASSCGENETILFIEFTDESSGLKNHVQLTFKLDKESYFISGIGVDVSSDGRNIVAVNDTLAQFATPRNSYYKCKTVSQVDLYENNVKLNFAETQFEAFRNSKTANFVGKELLCKSDTKSDVIIIAIGCALAVLIVVMLVAYLIARRRNRQRGYQSV